MFGFKIHTPSQACIQVTTVDVVTCAALRAGAFRWHRKDSADVLPNRTRSQIEVFGIVIFYPVEGLCLRYASVL